MEEEYRRVDERPIIKINIKDVLDFCYCPHYYKLKRNDYNANVYDIYDSLLHKVIYRYLRMLMEDKLSGSSIETLKYLWGREWVKEKTRSDIMVHTSSQWRNTYDVYRKMGIDAINNFNSMVNNVEQTPIAVNKGWEVNIASNLFLNGSWEYIREIDTEEGNVIQLIHFITQINRSVTSLMYRKDLLSTASLYSFYKTFESIPVQLIYVDLYSKKIRPTIRNVKDFEFLKKTVTSTALCLVNGIECSSVDRKCYFCEYRNRCASTIGNLSLERNDTNDENEYKLW